MRQEKRRACHARESGNLGGVGAPDYAEQAAEMARSNEDKGLKDYSTAVLLKDGSTLHLRPVEPGDEDRLAALFDRLSPHTVYLRFHHVLAHMSREEVKRFCNVDYDDAFSLAATIGEGEDEKIIGVSRYYRLPAGDAAEISLVVEDAYQDKGIGTHLLERMAAIAVEKGIRRFEADVLAENKQMLQVLEDSGFEVQRELDRDVYTVTMAIAPTPRTQERSAGRERLAAVASLASFMKPRSIAVVGASRREGTIGNKLFRNVLYQGFAGVVYPVNPNADVVAAVKTYPSVLDIPGEVDMAVIVVPAQAVEQVLRECGRKGVRGVVVISAGFGETGPEGMKKQDALLKLARAYGMRLVGPNCMGIINTDARVSLNATFSSVFPPAGNIAFCSQSGALGLAILEYALKLNIGLSSFVSIGNRAGVSSNDLLQYWADDPATDVILLYIECFGNPRKFARIAPDVTALKPVVVVKSGRTAAGSRAAASHTGALAGDDEASAALFRQAGIVRVDTLEELFDVAGLISHQPLPRGRRVAILTNGGGPGIMTADTCAGRGLEVPRLSDATIAAMKEFLPENASLANPIDMTAEATADQYGRALELLLRDDSVDIVIVIFIPPILTEPEAVAAAIRGLAPGFRERGKTLLASFMGAKGAPTALRSGDDGYVPCYTFPEETAGALVKACEYAEWLKRPKGSVPELKGIDRARAERIVHVALEKASGGQWWLDAPATAELLDCYGIWAARAESVRSARRAARAAREIGFPVALKLLSDTIVHKTEVGGVVLDLHSQAEVERAYAGMKKALSAMGRGKEIQGVTVQEMVSGGVEVIVGVTQDPSFGPLILFGSGGIYTELFKDVAFRIHPLTDVDAAEMARSVKVSRILEGWRGSKRYDIESVEDLLLRISAMVDDLPEIVELDLNPVKVLGEGKGYLVVDARVLVG